MRTLGTMIISYRCQLYTHFVLISCHYCRGRSYCWQVYCSRKFMQVQIRVQTLQKKFSWFLLLRDKCGMLWPHPHQLMPTPHMWTEEMKLNDERSKLAQQPSLEVPFVWRPSHLWRYQDCHCGRETAKVWLARLCAHPHTPNWLQLILIQNYQACLDLHVLCNWLWWQLQWVTLYLKI